MIYDNDLAEYFTERAGILEHCGGWPKEKAEALAKAETDAYQKHRDELKEENPE